MKLRLTAHSCRVIALWSIAALAQAQATDAAEPAADPVAPEFSPAPAPELPAARVPQAEPPAQALPHGPTPPNPNPYVYSRGYRRWTEAERKRVRRALAEARAQQQASPVPRRAPEGPRVYGDAGAAIALGIEINTIFRDDVGFQHFESGENSTRFGAFASHDVLTLARKLILAVEVGAMFEQTQAPALLGAGSHAELDSQSLSAGLDLRWDALAFLSPQLRASGGVSLFQIELSDRGRAFRDQHPVSGFVTLGAGLLFHTPARTFESRKGDLSSLGLGLLIEGGYALRSAIDVALREETMQRGIPIVDASLGRLNLSGPYIRTAILVRF